MTPIGPLDAPICHYCGGAKEILPVSGVPEVCPHCGGTGEEPPVPAAVLEEQGQQVLFDLAPLMAILIILLVSIGIADLALALTVVVCELIDWQRSRRERSSCVIPIASRRRSYPTTAREWERWG